MAQESTWVGWLRKSRNDSTIVSTISRGLSLSPVESKYQARLFVVDKYWIHYYAPAVTVLVGSVVCIDTCTDEELTKRGFTKKGSIERGTIQKVVEEKGENTLLIVTTARTYEIRALTEENNDDGLISFQTALEERENLENIHTTGRKDFEFQNPLPDGARFFIHEEVGILATSLSHHKQSDITVAVDEVKSVLEGRSKNEEEKKYSESKKGRDLLIRPNANEGLFDDRMTDLASSREKTIDEMKIQTMYKMVEDIEITSDGVGRTTKVLYLTNKQCMMFEDEGILRCLEALDLGRPKCVIRLLLDNQGRALWRGRSETQKSAVGQFLYSQPNGAELCGSDADVTSTQIDLVLKNCILPLAIKTNALIIVGGTNDSTIAASLERTIKPVQQRLGAACPFNVLSFVYSQKVHYKAARGEGLAGQVASGSEAWSYRLNALSEFMANVEDENIQRCDLISAASHMVIFESYNADGRNDGRPPRMFQSLLTETLTKKLPTIAIQLGEGITSDSVDLINRKVPVLILDLYERAISCNANSFNSRKMMPRDAATELARKSDAFPAIPKAHLGKFSKSADGFISSEARAELVNIAMQMIRSQMTCFIQNGIRATYDTCPLALLHSALTFGRNSNKDNFHNGAMLYSQIEKMTLQEQMVGNNRNNGVSSKELNLRNRDYRSEQELAEDISKFLCLEYEQLRVRSCIARIDKFLEKSETWPSEKKEENNKLIMNAKRSRTMSENVLKESSMNGEKFLANVDLMTNAYTYSGSVYDIDGVNRTLASVVKIDRLPKNNSLEALLAMQDAWDHVDAYNQLANLYKSITKVSYFVLLLAATVTSIVAITKDEGGENDETENSPRQYVVLALSLLITTIAGYVNFMNPAERWQKLRGAAMELESQIWMFRTRSGPYKLESSSKSSTHMDVDDMFLRELQNIQAEVLQGADIQSTTFFGQLKSHNFHLQHPPEAETLSYLVTNNKNNNNKKKKKKREKEKEEEEEEEEEDGPEDEEEENHYKHSEEESEKDGFDHYPPLLSSSEPTTKPTPPTSPTPRNTYKNKENEPILNLLRRLGRMPSEGSRRLGDSHFLPVLPDDYVRFRIVTAIVFYKQRIPLCNRTRHIVQLLSTLGSIASVILAFLNKLEWTVVTAIGTTSLMAWLEFQGTNNKIARYSSVVNALHSHMLWWNTRPVIEKSAVDNIDRLVMTTEDILRDEMNAWRSSSASQLKLLSDKTNAGSENSMISGKKSES